MKRNLLTFLLGLIGFVSVFAQQPPCGYFDLYQKVKENPTFQRKHADLERYTQQYTDWYFKKLAEKNTTVDTALFIIPVVFHVFWDCGEENISKAQIEDAIRILNLDFQAKHPDTAAVIPFFKPRLGNCRVEFRLARKDPQGNCTDGITRHQSALTYGGDEAMKAVVQWPPDQYLNIWVEQYITYSNAAAYSTLPGYPAAQDGIVVAYNYVGSIGTGAPSSSHILSHEVGHFFNLEHTWGTSPNPGLSQNCSLDDGVSDTPNTIGSAFSCNLAQSTCNDGLDNVQNIMDYSTCDIMFTQGQVARMQAALNSTVGSRNHLWIAANLQATGTSNGYISPSCRPIAELCRKTIYLCAGENHQFQNETYGSDSVGYNWSLPGSIQGVSTAKNPLVQYPTPGIYPVQFEAFNSAGNTLFSIENLVQVIPSTGSQLPVDQSFEIQNFPYATWKTNSETGNDWAITTQAFNVGSHSLYHSSNGALPGKKAVFYTESYDFSNSGTPFFNFKLAFARRNESADALKVYMSTDCSKTWTLRYSKTGSSLVTAVDTSAEFIPTTAQWRQEAFNVAVAAGKPNVRFQFEFTYRGGQNIYLDDLKLGTVVEVFPRINPDFPIRIFPNPAQSHVVVEIDTKAGNGLSVKIFGVDGRLVETDQSMEVKGGKEYLTIRRPTVPGLYLLHLGTNEKQSVYKISFE